MSLRRPEKPVEHVTEADWMAKIEQLRHVAEERHADARSMRQNSARLRNETYISTKWDTYHNDSRLMDRCSELRRWQRGLWLSRKAVEAEVVRLQQEKADSERHLEQLSVPRAVVVDCQLHIDARISTDLVHDIVHAELRKELGLVEQLKRDLSEKCHEAWVQLSRLDEALERLLRDLGFKGEAIHIDDEAAAMQRTSGGIGFRHDPLRRPKECVPYESWQQTSQNNMRSAEEEMSASKKLREDMFSLRARASNLLRAQHEATDLALRRRVFDTNRAKEELEWQRQKTVAEMAKVSREIGDLEVAVEDKTDPQKLVESRLELRMSRPHAELVHDYAQEGLGKEVLQLRLSVHDLRKQLASARETYNLLEGHLVRLDEDLSIKNQALTQDQHCQDIRKQLLHENIPPPT